MKSIKILTLLLTVLTMLFSACTKKEELASKTYYAKVVVGVANLPGTPKLEVRYQGQLLGDAPLLIPGTSVAAGVNTKMSVYVKDTGELVADTVLNLKKGELTNYKVAYSKEFGLSGWVNSPRVAPDSVSFQLLNNLKDFNKTHPVYDFYLYYYDNNTGEFVPAGVVIPDFQKVRLSPLVITKPYGTREDPTSPIYYLGYLKDPATGEFITDFFILPSQVSGGIFVIYNIGDAEGVVAANEIIL